MMPLTSACIPVEGSESIATPPTASAIATQVSQDAFSLNRSSINRVTNTG